MKTMVKAWSLILLLLCACQGKDKSAAPTHDEEVKNRVEAIYNDVFAHYMKDDIHADNYLPFFSERLAELYNQLPEDELVIDADLWTGAQDFDKPTVEDIVIREASEHSALAQVKVKVFPDNPAETIMLSLVKEKHGESELQWYVDDFKYGEKDGTSVAQSFQEAIRNK